MHVRRWTVRALALGLVFGLSSPVTAEDALTAAIDEDTMTKTAEAVLAYAEASAQHIDQLNQMETEVGRDPVVSGDTTGARSAGSGWGSEILSGSRQAVQDILERRPEPDETDVARRARQTSEARAIHRLGEAATYHRLHKIQLAVMMHARRAQWSFSVKQDHLESEFNEQLAERIAAEGGDVSEARLIELERALRPAFEDRERTLFETLVTDREEQRGPLRPLRAFACPDLRRGDRVSELP
jgi:hypothetical protein